MTLKQDLQYNLPAYLRLNVFHEELNLTRTELKDRGGWLSDIPPARPGHPGSQVRQASSNPAWLPPDPAS